MPQKYQVTVKWDGTLTSLRSDEEKLNEHDDLPKGVELSAEVVPWKEGDEEDTTMTVTVKGFEANGPLDAIQRTFEAMDEAGVSPANGTTVTTNIVP